MKRLTCVYCNNIINRSDTHCPNCGAETESSIRKFMEEKKAEAESCKVLIRDLVRRRRKRIISLVYATLALLIISVLIFSIIRPAVVKFIIFVLLVIAYAIYFAISIRDIKRENAKWRELNERINGLSHRILFTCEDVQPYKMINDLIINNEGCFKEGLQQIAFKVSITNISSQNYEFTLYDEFFAGTGGFGKHVWLIAEGVRMEECTLNPVFRHHEENNKTFEPPLYSEGFKNIILRPHESLVGWVGFYVTPEAEDLELLFADEYIMLKNPVSKSNG